MCSTGLSGVSSIYQGQLCFQKATYEQRACFRDDGMELAQSASGSVAGGYHERKSHEHPHGDPIPISGFGANLIYI